MWHFLKAVFRVGGHIIVAYFSWIRKFAKKVAKIPFEYRYKKLRKLLIRLSKALDIEHHVEGLENVPKETCFFVCNHLSAYDPVSLICLLDKPCTFVAKKELQNKPFAGKVITGIEGQFLDRGDLKQSLRIMMAVEKDLTEKKDKSWIIFPEGTRNKDQMHNIPEFHHGTFRPAYKSQTPIVPVAIYGTFRPLKKKPLYKRYPVCVEFLKPLYYEEYKDMTTQQIAEVVHDRIERAVTFNLKAKDHQLMLKYNKKKYRFNQIF